MRRCLCVARQAQKPAPHYPILPLQSGLPPPDTTPASDRDYSPKSPNNPGHSPQAKC